MNGRTQHEREKLKPTWCADDVYMSACESIFAYLKHNDMSWEWFIWLEIKGVQDGPFFCCKDSPKHRRTLIFIFPTVPDGAADDAGMMECRADAKERELRKTDILNAPDTLYFSHTDMAECKYHCCESPPIKKKKRIWLSFI